MRRKTALIVDDERAVRLLIEGTLGHTYECSLVCDGKQGFRLATEARMFDIITMDLAMPDWDGISALAMIDTFNPEAKIIVITAHLSAEAERELKTFRCVRRVLQKPFPIAQLEQIAAEVEAEGGRDQMKAAVT